MTRTRAALFASMLVTSMALPADAARRTAPVAKGKPAASAKKGGDTKKVNKLAKKADKDQKDTKKGAAKLAATSKKTKSKAAKSAPADAVDETIAPAPVAEAPAAAEAPRRNLAMRILGGIGRGLLRQVTMRPEMKADLTYAKFARKAGQLTLAAEVLRDAPYPQGMWERFRAWRGKKAVLKLARREVKAKRLDSDPEEGYAAFSTLNDAKMTSFIDRLLANRALNKGIKNAAGTAARLGEKGRFEEALAKIEWSIGEREGEIDEKTVEVVGKLYSQAMRASERSAIRVSKAHSPMDQNMNFEASIRALNMANSFGEMFKAATQHEIFDQNRASRVGQRMGLDQDGFNRAINEVARAQAGLPPEPEPEAVAAEEPVKGKAKGKGKSKLDTTKGDDK